MRRSNRPIRSRLVLRRGTLEDYRALAAFHYRFGDPAPGSHVWTLREPGARVGAGKCERGGIVAVLVVSRPVLNGPWREIVWPGRFSSGDRRDDARRLNRELRVISRVVVDPRYRGLGVGARLVRAYLRRPRTRLTEAIAAMGELSPLFERAGMRRVKGVPEARRHGALRRALARLGLRELDLGAPWAIPLRARRGLARALRRWANDSRATRRLARGRLGPLVRAGAGALRRPLVYVHGRAAARPHHPLA